MIFFGFGRSRLFSNFGEFVWAERVGFSLRIYEFDNITKHKICVSCVFMIHL
jgi:hypothetical protein